MIVMKPFGPYPDQWQWFHERDPIVMTSDTKGVAAYRDGNLVAVVALDHWTPNSVQIHIAVDDPLVFRYRFAEEVFEYAYNAGEKRDIIIGNTPSNNPKALKFNRHMGLTEVYRLKDVCGPGIDLVIQEMRRENCRWLKENATSESSAYRSGSDPADCTRDGLSEERTSHAA